MGITILNDIRCSLGEGPTWDETSQSLFWVDIDTKKIFAAAADGTVINTWRTAAPPSAVILAQAGRKLVTAGQQILELCTESGEMTPIMQLSDEPYGNRCNDAKCDPLGNLWVGTMDADLKQRQGRLCRLDSNGQATVFLDGIGIANTLAWDTLRGRFYFADSMAGDIYVFDYDMQKAEITKQQIFLPRDGAPGGPDGSAIDEEGYLWNARWDGGCVVRISPDGELDRVLELPTRRPTSCAFGGEGMKTLFITSAADDNDDLSGAVFSIESEVAGARIPAYAGPIG